MANDTESTVTSTTNESRAIADAPNDETEPGSSLRETKAEAAVDPSPESLDDSKVNVTPESDSREGDEATEEPPLPDETIPPLPDEAPPKQDDGWAPVWDQVNQAYYFYNRFTGISQWTNPRVPDADTTEPPSASPAPANSTSTKPRPAGGYDPAVHGDYDPTAWYAQPVEPDEPSGSATAAPTDLNSLYAQTAAFNRFTGRFQAPEINADNHNDENKSRRQMNAYFDVDAAANNHDGRSLKEERSGKKLSKAELRDFKEKRKAKKEEKRRAWLRD